MTCRCCLLTLLVALSVVPQAHAEQGFTYDQIASRYKDVGLDDAAVREAEMQGECLVGLKNLNFVKRQEFDPVSEWTNYRSLSLLEQFPPCTVLIIIEVAHAQVSKEAP